MDENHVSEYNKQYYRKHREEIALRRINKRHSHVGVVLTHDDWQTIKDIQKGKCLRCDKEKTLSPFLVDTKFVGYCKACSTQIALEMANTARERNKNLRLEQESSIYD